MRMPFQFPRQMPIMHLMQLHVLVVEHVLRAVKIVLQCYLWELKFQYALLPQGKVEAKKRVQNMVRQMDEEGFGNCTNTGACEVECPKGISLENIARMNRVFKVKPYLR